jgi:xanthine dehydrogenase accessory factor
MHSQRQNLTEAALPSRARLDTSLELLVDRMPTGHAAAVLATIVSTAGSTYRKPGARMLILEDGRYFGLLSGGCLEADLKMHAEAVLKTGIAAAVEYDMRGPDDVLFGLGAGCRGALRILLEPAGGGSAAAAAIAAAAQATAGGKASALVAIHEAPRGALGTVHREDGLRPELRNALRLARLDGRSRDVEWSEDDAPARAFVEYLAPPPHLLICGGGPDAIPVAAGARSLGWRVTVVDHRPAYAVAERFPGARVIRADARLLGHSVDLTTCHAAVVMSHHLPSDVAYLQEFAGTATPGYVGLLGPGERRRRVLSELGPVGEALRSRLHGPVGLDIGAATPEGIALSIVSHVHAWLAGRELKAKAETKVENKVTT